ncbi:MAG: hypothetical protein HUU11_01480, partial [Anaerolineales bacterium]|nr:hypothetical protein [Anaerolineales bacterium]
MKLKTLSLSDIHGSDPLGRSVLGRMNIKPISAALFFLASGVLYGFALPALWGFPLEADGINILNIVLVFPTAGFFYAYQPQSILRTYNSATRFLREN